MCVRVDMCTYVSVPASEQLVLVTVDVCNKCKE